MILPILFIVKLRIKQNFLFHQIKLKSTSFTATKYLSTLLLRNTALFIFYIDILTLLKLNFIRLFGFLSLLMSIIHIIFFLVIVQIDLKGNVQNNNKSKQKDYL